MATDLIDVKQNIIRTLQEELLADALGDHPLIKFDVNTMDKSARADMMTSQNLMSNRTDLMRTIAQKEQLFKNYRAIIEADSRVWFSPSQDAFPSLVLPLVSLSSSLVPLSFQRRTYNLSTLPFRGLGSTSGIRACALRNFDLEETIKKNPLLTRKRWPFQTQRSVFSGLNEFKEPEIKGYGPENSKQESNVVCEKSSKEIKKTPGAIIIEDWVLDDEKQDECKPKKKIVIHTAAKIEFVRPKQQEKPARKPVKYAQMYRSQSPRGNQRNWNNQKSQQLGSDFVMIKKACYMDAQTQGRHEHNQEFDAKITTVGVEVDDIAAET
ncbi:hypothetical protein Tco_0394713 [Tanacetum coccineum]